MTACANTSLRPGGALVAGWLTRRRKAAAHQQRRQGQIARTGFESLAAFLHDLPARPEPRGPVPVILAIGAQPDVLGQARHIARACAMRLVTGDRISHFIQRIEALRLAGHERLDLADPFGFDVHL